MFIDGHARRALVHNASLTMTGSSGSSFGEFQVGQFSRLAGMFSIVGSATFRYAMGAVSGTSIVTSSFVVNSGASVFDLVQYGHWAALSFSQAASQTGATVFVFGEAVR
jgi:hypothetical protein